MQRSPTEPKAKFPLLVSYEYLRRVPDERIKEVLGDPGLEVLLDSGAFTALNAGREVLLGDYMAFLHKWKHLLWRYMALDVLGSPALTDANMLTMLADGLKPVPVHVRGDDEARMDHLFQQSDFVALGGLRLPHRGVAPRGYIKLKMDWAKGRNVHWLGYTSHEMVQAFKPYSCDSSNWSAAHRYGRMSFYLGRGKWSAPWTLERARAEQPTPAMLHTLQRCGFTLGDFRDARLWRWGRSKGIPGNRFLSMWVNTYSWVCYIRDLRRHVGTRLFLATTVDEHIYRPVAHWIAETAA